MGSSAAAEAAQHAVRYPMRHPVWSLASWAAAMLMILLSASLCAGVLWNSVWLGAGALWDPNDNTKLQDWTRSIGFSAQALASTVTAAAFGIGLVGVITVIAAWRRSRLWIAAGAVSAALLLATLALGYAVGYSSLSSLIASTHERIGPVSLVEPTAVDGQQETSKTEVAPPLSHADAEAAIIELTTAAERLSTGPLTSVNPLSGEETGFAAEAAPLVFESCAPTTDGELGTHARFRFSLPSDADGAIAERLVVAWDTAGYPVVDQMRSERFMGNDLLPIHQTSINDRFTIDGRLWVDIDTRCVSIDE